MSTLKRKATEAAGSDSKKTKANGNITSFFGAPKPTPTNFDKAKWVASLTAEQKELLQLEINTLHDSWLVHLKDDIMSKEFLNLKRFLATETKAGHKWFPPAEDVYSW